MVDASPFGLGVILVQDNKAICYTSRALTDVEKHYSQTIENARCCLWSQIFSLACARSSIQTDHRPQTAARDSQKAKLNNSPNREMATSTHAIRGRIRVQAGQKRPKSSRLHQPTSSNKTYQRKAGEEYITFLPKYGAPKCTDAGRGSS